MKLISFPGLNCFQSCVMSIAQQFEIDYSLAFSSLWSETDFLYENYFELYSSKRMPHNLFLLGIKLQKISLLSPEQVKNQMNRIENGEIAIVGLDAFYIPWSPLYMIGHSLHYFFIKKENATLFSCYDPSYGETSIPINGLDIILPAFELHLVEIVEKTPLPTTAICEVEIISQNHPLKNYRLSEKIETCSSDKKFLMLGRYVDALIQNRYLYQHYQNMITVAAEAFDDDFFIRWKAVKNGLIKASLMKKKEKIIKEIIMYLESLIHQEVAIAETIFNKHKTEL